MAKRGKKRGKRRPPKGPGGQGEASSPRLESGLTPSQENVLISRAIRHNFPLDEEGFKRCVEAAKKNMLNEDGRVSNGAVKCWIEMTRRQDILAMHEEEMTVARGLEAAIRESAGGHPAGATGPGQHQDPPATLTGAPAGPPG